MKNSGIFFKTTALLLTAVMLVSVFTACAGNGNESDTTNASDTTAAETERLWLDDLEDVNFDGMQFRVYGDGSEWNDPGAPDVARKDVISAANYDRYHNVQERFNMEFKYIEPTIAPEDIRKPAIGLQSYVTSQLDEFDVIHGIVCYLAPSAMEGYVIDMAAYDEFTANIDLDQPWWSREYTDALSLDVYKYWIYGACDAGLYSNPFCIFFNKEMADIFLNKEEGETMYDFVYDGTWTLSKLFELEKAAYLDDGDGAVGNNDRYGLQLTSGNFVDKLGLAAGASFTKRDENNIPYSDINTERNININEMLFDIMTNDGCANYGLNETSSFENGNVMMYMGMVGTALGFRNIKWDFGLLPLPKYDESQEDYYGVERYSALIDGVPITVPTERYDFIFTILEANSAEVWRLTRPAFLDEGLKNKYSRDEDTKAMVDLTQQNIKTDFLICYTSEGGTNGYEYFFHENISSGTRDISSSIARKNKPINKTIEQILEKFAENSQQN